jgi:hypothetical protein
MQHAYSRRLTASRKRSLFRKRNPKSDLLRHDDRSIGGKL